MELKYFINPLAQKDRLTKYNANIDIIWYKNHTLGLTWKQTG